ncbi:protein FAM131A isoform X2 [Denticeps clupeoides]|uniref:Protein FAM131A n=1 Tax=Denticeps clupeoides TaxID=299321 RepID=A0AAY4ABA7_9TELE|nr:protein FAM131A-like isoform X2 [Denticeps clupeoides]
MLLTALPQLNIKVEDPTDMLPKSRKALSIQEIAALARSSFNGISQVVKDHVTKPTAMAQGRVAHLIEWKGWSKPLEPNSATLQSHFSSYSHLTEGEQEARFAAGVAEQFAIAEAKLRAWTSVDEEEDCDEESCDEDNNNEPSLTDATLPRQAETDSAEAAWPSTLVCSQVSLLEPTSVPELGLLGREEEQQLPGPIQEADGAASVPAKPSRRSLWSGGDSCYYSTNSYSESGLSPEEEEEQEGEEGEDNVFREALPPQCYSHCRSFSDTSGVVSFEEEEMEERERLKQ